jgi:hypothetical protein
MLHALETNVDREVPTAGFAVEDLNVSTFVAA